MPSIVRRLPSGLQGDFVCVFNIIFTPGCSEVEKPPAPVGDDSFTFILFGIRQICIQYGILNETSVGVLQMICCFFLGVSRFSTLTTSWRKFVTAVSIHSVVIPVHCSCFSWCADV